MTDSFPYLLPTDSMFQYALRVWDSTASVIVQEFAFYKF